MNRIIKYKAFDRINKVWLGPYTLKELTYCDKFFFDIEEKKVSGSFDDYDWVEFTGLTDKSNVEIYESDIVKWRNTKTNIEGVSEVRYHSRLCRFEISDGEVWYQLNPVVIDYKAIGNTYEHPHLLTDKAEASK